MACKYTYNGVEYSKEQLVSKLGNENSNFNTLYNNLVNEITNTETGRKVLDRIKKDYDKKLDKIETKFDLSTKDGFHINGVDYGNYGLIEPEYFKQIGYNDKITISEEEYLTAKKQHDSFINSDKNKYTLGEQQEEALVELLGLMTAEKLDNVKDGKLISLLKRLLKEMKQFIRSLINQKEVEIDKLPDNMTIGDLSDLLAYSNSKLILPGYEVGYTTPDNQKFKTYQEASNHISELAKSVEDVDLDDISIPKTKEIKTAADIPVNKFEIRHDDRNPSYFVKKEDKWFQEVEREREYQDDDGIDYYPVSDETILKYYLNPEIIGVRKISNDRNNLIQEFLTKNKEYEQSKEIIEEWKKINNIVYNPEEIYSRGQEFSSVVGAYSSFDVNLMMQNLLSHIEDNEKAGGKFAISAFTKPIDKTIGHLEGGGGKIKFKIFPKSEDILWAANTDVYSGSVWDASEKVNKDKKSELLGVSYTKYPFLSNVNAVQPNLADIVDKLNHHHNELGIVLTGNNFRLEYDEDIPYTTKKIIDGINKILDQKYGKLVKPEINKEDKNRTELNKLNQQLKVLQEQEEELYLGVRDINEIDDEFAQNLRDKIYQIQKNISLLAQDARKKGIQPTQTNETLKESIDSIANKLDREIIGEEYSVKITRPSGGIEMSISYDNKKDAIERLEEDKNKYKDSKVELVTNYKYGNEKEKEYTSQALINTKIAKLKEVAKKYPRSLIRSEVKPINKFNTSSYEQFDELEDLPFQKIPSVKPLESKKNIKELETSKTNIFGKSIPFKTEEQIRYDYSEEIKQTIFNGNVSNISAKQALYNILDSGMFDKNSKEYEMIHRMIISTKATVKIVDSKDMKSTDTYMQYNTVDNTIELSLDNLGQVSSVKEGVEKFLHEIYHDRTLRILRAPKNESERQLRDDLQKVYDVLKPVLEGKYSHEMSSLEEFTAGMFSNKEFEAEVERLINAKTNFWDKLVVFFRKLFGLSTDYDNLIESLLRLIDITDESYTGKDTLEAKYNYGQKTIVSKKGLNKISESIDKTFEDLEGITNRSQVKNAPFLTKLNSVKGEINQLLDKYAKDSEEYRLESIKVFNTFMKDQLHSLKLRINNPDITKDQYKSVKVYNQTFVSLQSHIDTAIDELRDNKTITPEEYLELTNQVEELISTSAKLTNNIKKVAVQLNKKAVIFSEQHKDIYLKYEMKFRQEGKSKGLIKADLDEYVNKQLSENRELIQKETDEDWNAKTESPLTDISSLSAAINSEKDFTHSVIRVFSRILDKVKYEYTNLIQPRLLELQEATNTFLEGNRTKSSDENYKNLVEWSKDDEGFLLGEYQIGFRDSFNELMNTVNAEDFGEGLSEEDKLKLKKSTMRKWFKENTTSIQNVDEEGNVYYTTKPLDKWKTDFSKLSQKERDYLEVLRKDAKFANDNYGIDVKSLKKTTLGVEYYKLPSHHKQTITHLKNLNKDIFKELWNDTFKLRTDDTTQGEQDFVDDKNVHIVHRNLAGKEVNYIPIHFRGKIPKSQQSTDLATMYAMEVQQSIKFKEKTKVHDDLEIFIDVIQENGFIQKQGIGERVISYFNKDGTTTPVIADKEDAHLIKMLHTMMNNRLYDKTSTYLGKIGNADGAKIESFIRGVVSRTSQAINFIGAPANVIGGKAQAMMEVISDPNLAVKNVKNAELFFFNHIGSTIDDLGRNVYKSLPNQIVMSFGGLVTSQMIQNNFEKNKALAFANTKPLFFMQEGGEHWTQVVHTLTILDAAKILDKDGNYLDKNGNITTKKNAVSLLNTFVLENGKLTTSIKTPFYTTLDRMKEYNKGGNATIMSYIQSSLIKSQGNYNPEYGSELQRKTLGKALTHFKKHMIQGTLRRWRGGHNMFANPEEEIIVNFDSDLQRPDEGNYVTWIRFLTRSVAPKIKNLQFSLLVKEWSEMDEWEKGNIVRTFTELAYIITMANLALLAYGAASDDDDDDSFFWHVAAITRRSQSDASQFFDPTEAWRVLKNPISSLKFLESSVNVIGALGNVVNPMGEDKVEKLQKSSSKMIKYLIPGYGHIIDNTAKEQYIWSNR